jgi:hypothetical protein
MQHKLCFLILVHVLSSYRTVFSDCECCHFPELLFSGDLTPALRATRPGSIRDARCSVLPFLHSLDHLLLG